MWDTFIGVTLALLLQLYLFLVDEEDMGCVVVWRSLFGDRVSFVKMVLLPCILSGVVKGVKVVSDMSRGMRAACFEELN